MFKNLIIVVFTASCASAISWTDFNANAGADADFYYTGNAETTNFASGSGSGWFDIASSALSSNPLLSSASPIENPQAAVLKQLFGLSGGATSVGGAAGSGSPQQLTVIVTKFVTEARQISGSSVSVSSVTVIVQGAYAATVRSGESPQSALILIKQILNQAILNLRIAQATGQRVNSLDFLLQVQKLIEARSGTSNFPEAARQLIVFTLAGQITVIYRTSETQTVAYFQYVQNQVSANNLPSYVTIEAIQYSVTTTITQASSGYGQSLTITNLQSVTVTYIRRLSSGASTGAVGADAGSPQQLTVIVTKFVTEARQISGSSVSVSSVTVIVQGAYAATVRSGESPQSALILIKQILNQAILNLRIAQATGQRVNSLDFLLQVQKLIEAQSGTSNFPEAARQLIVFTLAGQITVIYRTSETQTVAYFQYVQNQVTASNLPSYVTIEAIQYSVTTTITQASSGYGQSLTITNLQSVTVTYIRSLSSGGAVGASGTGNPQADIQNLINRISRELSQYGVQQSDVSAWVNYFYAIFTKANVDHNRAITLIGLIFEQGRINALVARARGQNVSPLVFVKNVASQFSATYTVGASVEYVLEPSFRESAVSNIAALSNVSSSQAFVIVNQTVASSNTRIDSIVAIQRSTVANFSGQAQATTSQGQNTAQNLISSLIANALLSGVLGRSAGSSSFLLSGSADGNALALR